ncbi:hypothetical protein BU23DRAFT_556613 [Bimuria novae-zelandiae CBS 107.79]|uniref:Ubiquitin-like domain-containing protein n=1 Tax=Bimuria novae-zelandiae CBS 107.79 TaxID=1447943 RepID=A0A6A5V3M7_9PLEO|nr:hypothetical protein BU23DRAFT_556613 [Bimuria novae-zelandiae CBS 107.79]
MAEDATTGDPSIASSGAPTVDQPGRTTSENDPVPKAPQLDKLSLFFVLDHNGDKYPIPWQQGKDYLRFKSYVEEIYARDGDTERLEQVRSDKFNVVYDAADESHVILPSLWNDLVHEGMTLRILFGHAPQFGKQQRSSSKGKGNEFVDVDVDVGHEDGGGSDSTGSPVDEASSQSDEDDTEGSETEESETALDVDGNSSDAPPAEPIRMVNKPIDKEGSPLSFTVDTRWAGKYFSLNKENDSSETSLINKFRSSRDLVTETLRITKAVTKTADNRTTLEVYTLPGPEKSALSSSITIRWVHMHGDALNWAQFKQTCLTLPDLEECTKFLVVKTLHKIEKEYTKAFLGGMFIEPGTVLRGDESNRPDPHSVIFSCTPYFDIRKSNASSTPADKLHPARTLMQSYYPYEPVRERDEEQAYKKFGNARPNELIHVPSLWMLNVSNRAVVTCGYGPLSNYFTNSIKVVQEDLGQLGAGNDNTTTTIRLTDLDGRVLLYSTQECGTYFQLEQRLRELRRSNRSAWETQTPQVLLRRGGEIYKSVPSTWPTIIRQRDCIFIDLAIVDEMPEKLLGTIQTSAVAGSLPDAVPPFYHWPTAWNKDEVGLESLPVNAERVMKCLERVERAMLNVTLPESDTGGPVDRTFTSTQYYESLPENDFEDVEKSLLNQLRIQGTRVTGRYQNHHQAVVQSQTSKLPGKAYEFTRIVHETLFLFVGKTDKSTLLQKVWGAIANLTAVVERLGKYSGCESDPREYNDSSWKTPKTKTRAWRIRTPTTSYTYANQHATRFNLPLPNGDQEFGATVKKCRRCAREAPFDDPNAALEHLRNHAAAESSKQGGSPSSSFIKDTEEWKDWIRNDDQALLESTITGACAVLDRAMKEAQTLYEQLQELADGVRDDQGKLSDLYSFPRKLLETLHRLLVFYFAVERSLHYTEQNFLETKKGGYQEDYPYTSLGLEILDRFSESVKPPLQHARVELCEMVRSTTPKDPTERLSLGAESISSWLIRRLIVKPLEKGLTIGDMYREYLTTLQFQVNHRPSKRLLRSINLLKEELNILTQVNDWQTQLVNNYALVLDDTTYPVDIPSRRAFYRFEKFLLRSCLERLALDGEEYQDQIRRCGPLTESTKQSAEINEEDHGKAIMVFTIVTVIFLPLSFVTSYLGMNTSDIRDMDNTQSLFWETALPLTVGVMAIMLAIAYNGDEILDFASSVYRYLTGKQDRSLSARGISVLQRNRAPKNAGSSTTLSLADDAEYAAPRAKPGHYHDAWFNSTWERPQKYKASAIPDQEFLSPEDSWYTRPSVRKPAFPPFQHEAVPLSYTEPIAFVEPTTYAEPISRKAALRTRLNESITLPTPPPPPPPPQLSTPTQPTYMRIHKDHIDPSVLDSAYLPWEDDPTDPSYILVKRYLSPRETDKLFEESKRVIAARAPTRFDDERGRFRTDDPWKTAKYAYVWESKRDKRRRAGDRRRGWQRERSVGEKDGER